MGRLLVLIRMKKSDVANNIPSGKGIQKKIWYHIGALASGLDKISEQSFYIVIYSIIFVTGILLLY